MVSEIAKINSRTKTEYPKSVAFIISNEFCERFNFYGLKTILVLYLTRRLLYDDDTATVLYHIFTSLVYFFPFLGAIIADSWWGRFKTILYLSLVYAVGTAIIAIGAIPPLNLPAKAVTILGLILIASGTGGIKPCVSAFGGDQFKLPEQAKQLATFFSLFYFAINAGSLLSTSITPILREDIHCFGEQDCFPLAFGVPGVLMLVSVIIFIAGRRLYVIKETSGNMIVMVSKCIGNAIKTKMAATQPKQDHWLDYAEPKYGAKLVQDIKILLNVLVLYLPLPVFWALFDQQGSRWTFQATKMTGQIGSFYLKPDQIQVINPLLILAFIPLFDYFVYPMLSKIGFRRPLQKLTVGGLCAGAAFLISGFLELQLEKSAPALPSFNEAQLRLFNGQGCAFNFETDIPNFQHFSLGPYEMFTTGNIDTDKTDFLNYNATTTDKACSAFGGSFKIVPGESQAYFLRNSKAVPFVDYIDKPKKGLPWVRILSDTNGRIVFKSSDHIQEMDANYTALNTVTAGIHKLFVDEVEVGDVEVKLGGVYTVIVAPVEGPRKYILKTHIVTPSNSIHMLWQIPQYVIITIAEVLFSVTGLEFSFTQAPTSMKSVLQAMWLLTVAFGNMIVVIIAEFRIFDEQSKEFFLFSGLMFLDMMLFVVLAMRYKYVEPVSPERSPVATPKKIRNGVDNQAFTEHI